MSQNPQDKQTSPPSLRLPNYRFLHVGRYHPYPTFNRQQGGTSQEDGDVEVMVGVMSDVLDVLSSPSPPFIHPAPVCSKLHKDDPAILTTAASEGGPSAQQDPSVLMRLSSLVLPTNPALQTQVQLAADESMDADLANLATVVDELQSGRPRSPEHRDRIGIVVARLPILIG